MKYTFEERLEIGRQIYDDELTKFEASEQYGISINCSRDYMRLYRDKNRLPPKNVKDVGKSPFASEAEIQQLTKKLSTKTKDELIKELIDAKITIARLKKSKKSKAK